MTSRTCFQVGQTADPFTPKNQQIKIHQKNKKKKKKTNNTLDKFLFPQKFVYVVREEHQLRDHRYTSKYGDGLKYP
jgi:hypothetical protein